MSGVISEGGKRLRVFLDGTHVKTRWIADYHVIWQTGQDEPLARPTRRLTNRRPIDRVVLVAPDIGLYRAGGSNRTSCPSSISAPQ